DAARAQMQRVERERQACAEGARSGEQQWEGRGVVRAAYPQLLLITHEEIRGLLPARTTGFRAASLALRDAVRVGDPIRFSLRGAVPEDFAVVRIQGGWAPPLGAGAFDGFLTWRLEDAAHETSQNPLVAQRLRSADHRGRSRCTDAGGQEQGVEDPE